MNIIKSLLKSVCLCLMIAFVSTLIIGRVLHPDMTDIRFIMSFPILYVSGVSGILGSIGILAICMK